MSAPQSIKKLSLGWKDSAANEGEEKKEKRMVRMTRRIAIMDDDDMKGDRKGCVRVFIVFSIFPIPPGGLRMRIFFQFRMKSDNNKEA